MWCENKKIKDMKRLYVSEIEDDVCNIADTLREIANRLDEGYTSGISFNGTSWYIEDVEDDDDNIE